MPYLCSFICTVSYILYANPDMQTVKLYFYFDLLPQPLTYTEIPGELNGNIKTQT